MTINIESTTVRELQEKLTERNLNGGEIWEAFLLLQKVSEATPDLDRSAVCAALRLIAQHEVYPDLSEGAKVNVLLTAVLCGLPDDQDHLADCVESTRTIPNNKYE